MKLLKIFTLLILFLNTNCAFGEKLTGGVDFDWVEISQRERNTLVEEHLKDVLVQNPEIEFDKGKTTNKVKDPNCFKTYGQIKAGIEEDENKIMVAFFFHDIFISYGIIEKTNLRNAYYYDVMGNLKYVDFMEKDYGNYPYVTNQYDKNGKLIARVYNVSKYDQFMYAPDGRFLGRWYQDKQYNKKGKVVSTRSWY